MALAIDFSTGLLACVGLLVCYPVAIVIYNLFFHPLHHYPGPLLLRATRLGFCYKVIRGTLPFDILALHAKYGDVVRIAPNELSYNNARAWKDIMGHRSHGAPEFEKYQLFYRPTTTIPPTIVSANGREHSILRRQLSHGFSERSLREQQPLIMRYVDLLVQRLHDKCKGGAVDMMAWYNFTTFDIIGDLAFGEPFGCLEKSEYHPWIRGIFMSARLGTIVQTVNHYPFLKSILFYLLATKSTKEAKGRNLARAKEKLGRRIEVRAKEGGRPDLIEGLLNKKDELNLSFVQLAANSNTLVIGGSETTATLLSGVTYYLLTHKDALEKLKNEVRLTFASEDEIDIISVNKLSYMLACLDETLRLYPPVAMGLPRVSPSEGATICGRFVPGNTTVAIHQWAINRNEAYFKNPFGFHPERFLGDPEYASDNREALQPFHVGPRNCLGRNLAYVEMRLILARIIWNFDLELADESRNWVARQKVFILWDKGPLMVQLTPVTER